MRVDVEVYIYLIHESLHCRHRRRFLFALYSISYDAATFSFM